MKLSLLFGLICVGLLGLYATLFAVVSAYPDTALALSMFILIAGWGAGAFFILALVMFVLRR